MLWRADYPLVLASGSATRGRLLAAAGLPFEAIPADVDERAIEASLPKRRPCGTGACARPRQGRGRQRAKDRRRWSSAPIRSSPATAASFINRRRARRPLRALGRLAGRTHRLDSAFALAQGGEIVAAQARGRRNDHARARIAAALALYLDAAGPDVLGSVGVYQYEGLGAHLFDRVEGDHSTILGLPMLPLLAALRRLGALAI